jgi:peptidoglycan hydrolase-like protein with peptidoglycan-binding domain
MNLRIVKKGTGDVRHLVVCYYIGAYADAQLIKSTPDNVCIINDTRTPTRRYTNISQNHKTGIASLQSTVQWITQKLNFNVDKIIVGAFSAGGQAARTILLNSEIPNGIFVADGTHCATKPQQWQIKPWIEYCNLAKQSNVSAVFSHTQIIPPTFSSTKKTLQLITSWPLDHKGTLEHPASMTSGMCEVLSYTGKNAAAHSQQATAVFDLLLQKTLINLKIVSESSNVTKIKVTSNPQTWRSPLELGMKGDDIKEWQKVLLNEGFNIGATADDGHFGKKTEQATMSWQLLKGVAIDGKVGPETIDAISNTNTNTADVPWQDPTKSLGERALYFSLSEKTKNVKEVPNGSNTSPEIKEYFKHATRIVKGQEKKLGLSAGNWCAVSSCYATKQALLKDEKMPHGYRAGVVELIQDSMKLGNWKSAKDIRDKKYIMQRGDLAIFDRSVPGKPNTSWWRHVARVETVVQKDNKTFRTLGGNEKNCYQFTERDITTKKFIGCIAYPQVIYDISNEPAPLIAPDPITKYPEGDAGWPHILKMIQNLVKHFNESFK